MQPREADTLGPSDLQAYSLGKLDAERAAQVEALLAVRPDWCAVLDAAPDDDVVRHLRGAGELPTVIPRLTQGTTVPDRLPGGSSADLAGRPSDPAKALADHPRYRLLRKLGEGGMGDVYLAEHRLMHRPVALKVIRPAFVNHPNAVDRFRREVRAAARLSHPNIVTAHDAEEAGGVHFLVMEYIDGTPLSDWLARHGRLPVPEACVYVQQVAVGLQYAHERGMVHRDLNPHNLMRTRCWPAGCRFRKERRWPRRSSTRWASPNLSASCVRMCPPAWRA